MRSPKISVQGQGEFSVTLFRDTIIAKSNGPLSALIKNETVFDNFDHTLLTLLLPWFLWYQHPVFNQTLLFLLLFSLDSSPPRVHLGCLLTLYAFFCNLIHAWVPVLHPCWHLHFYLQSSFDLESPLFLSSSFVIKCYAIRSRCLGDILSSSCIQSITN